MKKIVGLLAITACVTACDDGDIVFENLNFDENQRIQKCQDSELYFKINNNELLLVDFTRNLGSNQKGSWLNPEAELNLPTSPPADSGIKIYYRTYDGTINNNTICSLIPPANPRVTTEYISVPGDIITYTRTMTPAVNEEDVIVTYGYTFNFQNMTLSNGDSEIKYTDYSFGTFVYDTTRLSFSFNNIDFCNQDHALTGYSSPSEFFRLVLPDDFEFATSAATQTIQLDNNHTFSYIVYAEILSNINPCESIDKRIKEEWIATEGTLTVETLTSTSGQRHILKIQNTKFTKDNGSFVITDKEIGIYDSNVE